MEGVDGEAPMEVDEVADDEQQEEVTAETPSMEDDEVAGLEEVGNGAKATGEADKVASEEEDGVGAKACAQVDEEVAEACDKNSGSMDQKLSTSYSDPPRMLDFDLNEMPPEED